VFDMMSLHLLLIYSAALELLQKQSKKPNSSLSGHERTVQYLQRLGEFLFPVSEWPIDNYCVENLEMSGNLTPVRKMSKNRPEVRELFGENLSWKIVLLLT